LKQSQSRKGRNLVGADQAHRVDQNGYFNAGRKYSRQQQKW